jgi:HTH-type transcriptional regulator/antitoxin HigA
MPAKVKAPSERYVELIHEFRLRPIRTEKELDAATAVVHKLVTQKSLTKEEQDYLDVLTDLVEAYEDVHYPIPKTSGREMLRLLLEESGITQSKLAADIGVPVSAVNDLLSGKRKFLPKYVAALSSYFKVHAEAFLGTDSNGE